MKNKVLLSTLLGGALLAGCTADDALDAKKVAEGVNPAAPVFTISFNDDDALTRATMDGADLKWQKTDKMSLYHGGGAVSGTGSTWSVGKHSGTDDFLASGQQVRKFDAIYSGTEDGHEFTTASMVTEGLAIMIYPADTAYVQTKNNPHIFLTNEQDENTKLQTPYVSEVLEIGEYNGKDYEQTAGYGRKYELRMRPIGSLLRLTLNGQNNEKLAAKGIGTPNFKKVKIEVAAGEDGEHNPFTTEMWVKIGKERRNKGKTGGSDLVGTNTEQYENWKYSPWIEPVDANEKIGELAPRTNWISTTDIENNKTAYFTLLPYEDRPDVDVVIDEEGVAKYGDVTITVETNYGKVTMTSKGDKDEDKLFSNLTGTKKENIKDGLTYVLKSLFEPMTLEEDPNTPYEGQLVGTYMDRILTVDLSDLDMNNLHISNQEDLNKALDVYEALEKTDAARFILDGDEDGSKKFYMNYATWKRVADLMANEKNKITFAACDDEKPCTTIVLTGNDPENTNVPALVFDNKGWTSTGLIQGTFIVELAKGTTWTFDATQEKAKTMEKVKTLVVAEGATLNLTNTTINVFNNMSGTNAFELVNNGTVNIKGDVYLKNNMTNHGTIVIPAATDEDGENRFLMATDGKLTNREMQGEKAVMPAVTTITNENNVKRMGSYGGVIENSGTLATVESATKTSITNYGTINVNTKEARTLITSNADAGADIAKPFTNEQQKTSTRALNRFGVINLQVAGAGAKNMKIDQAGQQGFIKSINASHSNCNYAVCEEKLTEKPYVELQHPNEEIDATKISVTALIIPEKNSIFIPSDVEVSVDSYLYLKGSITRAGSLSGSYSHSGYFGGSDKDKDNIFKY